MPQSEIESRIKTAEEAAKTRAAEGKKTVEELSPHIGEVEYNVSNLNYELARRKAESMLFTPEELEARKKMLTDLESYNAPKVKAEKEAAEAAKQAELERLRKEAQQKETDRIQQSVKARQAEIDAAEAAKAKEWDESLTTRAKDYSQMTPEEQAEFAGKWSKRPKDKESLKTILQRAEEMLKGPAVPPTP
jgi:hypothetical protein